MAEAASGGYELTILLALAFRALVDQLHARLATRGYDDVRPAHGFVFSRLAPDGATGQELAEHLGITKQAASQMIAYLEERGYVARTIDPRDHRGKIVRLTGRGWGCIRETEAIFTQLEGQWAEQIGPDRMRALRDDLRRFVFAANDGAPPRGLRPVW